MSWNLGFFGFCFSVECWEKKIFSIRYSQLDRDQEKLEFEVWAFTTQLWLILLTFTTCGGCFSSTASWAHKWCLCATVRRRRSKNANILQIFCQNWNDNFHKRGQTSKSPTMPTPSILNHFKTLSTAFLGLPHDKKIPFDIYECALDVCLTKKPISKHSQHRNSKPIFCLLTFFEFWKSFVFFFIFV